ncbi:MAG: C4-dicarboxylate ABC transporter substrate-binding protein, partial [Candidatus Competibacteraceae bacterium]|nr:C4-dicarboxylate ABC transporter substrate-binding protein [Candidatus Competibacteraceae bacterium]
MLACKSTRRFSGALAGILAGVLFSTLVNAQTTLTFGGSDAIGSLLDRANKKFTDLVNERAEGKLKINFIQGEQLGNDVQVIEQMMQGSVHLYGDVLGWYANWVKDFAILNWGFTFRDNDHMQTFLES